MACLNCNGPCSDVNSECYNGCSQIVSDKCVKYTGVNVAVLGIENGDTLARVEQQLIVYLVSLLNGSGIRPAIEESVICQIVRDNLPSVTNFNLIDLLKALIEAVCELNTLITGNTDDISDIQDLLDDLESNYTIGCLSGVTPDSGTHDILQAVINRLCSFITFVDSTYVKIDDIDTFIGNYLTENDPPSTKQYLKMVPYTVVEFYPTVAILANFDTTGKGTGDWEKIYLCNGNNDTPDRRGRVGVGVTDGTMKGSITMDPEVNPSQPGNPNYGPTTSVGSNKVILQDGQMPKHKHIGSSVTVTIPAPADHRHELPVVVNNPSASNAAPGLEFTIGPPASGTFRTRPSSITIPTPTVNTNIVDSGNNEAHSNIQPSIGCYYIMYIP